MKCEVEELVEVREIDAETGGERAYTEAVLSIHTRSGECEHCLYVPVEELKCRGGRDIKVSAAVEFR